MRRYSFRIIVAGLKEDIQKLFPNHQVYGMQILRLVNDPNNNIPQNMKLLAAWCFLEPTTNLPDVRHSIEQIIYEKIVFKISLKGKTLTIGSADNEKTFSKPSEFFDYLNSQIRTSIGQVSTETSMEPILQSPDGKIKIFKIFGENAPQQAKELAGDTTWCITKPTTGMYYTYRNMSGSTFYFVFDENLKGTPLEKVAVDLQSLSKLKRLTDLNNKTGENLTADIPGYKGTDWDAYSSYLREKGIDLDEKDESGQNKLRSEPLSSTEVEEHELLKEPKNNLVDFQQLFTNANIRRNFPSKYLSRGHGLTNEQFDWLLNNQNRVNTDILLQYIESANIPADQAEKIKKFPKFLKRFKAVLLSVLEQSGYMRTDLKSFFTPEELKQANLSKNEEGIFFFPEGYLDEEHIESEYEKDPNKFIESILKNRRFDMITPKIKDKIYDISIKNGQNLLYYPRELFFPDASLSELAQYIAKFPDTNYGQLALHPGILLDPKFLKLLSSVGFNGWTKMFKVDSNLQDRFVLGSSGYFFASLIQKDITLLSLIPKEDIPKKVFGKFIEEYLATTLPDLFEQIISNSNYATKFDRFRLFQFSKFPGVKDEYDESQSLRTNQIMTDVGRQAPQIEMGQLPENTPVNVPENNQSNSMVGLMKKLDDKGMYGVADKVQNLWKRTVDKTKESLDKLS